MLKKETFKSTCCYCGVGCGIIIQKNAGGQIKVDGDPDHPVNRGMLCSKGMNLHHTANDYADRLLLPQVRMNKTLPLQNATWDQALDRVAAVFKAIIKKHGPKAVGFYVSGQCLTEEYYLWNKIMKGFIGANNIDTNSRLCMSSAVVGYKKSLGEDTVPVCYDDIEQSTCIYVQGANPAWCHPILWRRVEAHKAANPSLKIIVVDPRITQSAAVADLHLQILPGTDIELNHAIGRQLIENQQISYEFIEKYTDGFQTYKELVFSKTIDQYATICGISSEEIKTAAEWIGHAEGFLSMWTMGLNQSYNGVSNNLSLINLSLITGKIGKPGCGPFSLTGQPNAMGGREVGGLATMLASHREISNAAHRADMEDFWGVAGISDQPGLTATEMFEALESGQLKAIWIACTNPMVSLPNARAAEKALKNAPFVVVQDISNRSDTLAFADVVLPAAAWAEKTGTMTNAERRISLLDKALDPPGKALPDVEILWRFADKMGWKNHFNYTSAEQVFDEYKQTTAGTNIDCTGVSYGLLRQKTVQWPYSINGETKARLFEDNHFYTENLRAKISAVVPEQRPEGVSADFPLVLLTGRIRDQWHTQTKTAKVNKLNQHIPEARLQICDQDAAARDIQQGQLVTIKNIRGSVEVLAQITDEVKPGTCFLPMHWGKILNQDFSRANNLTSQLVDPVSKEPDYKYTAVQVEAYRKPKEKIVVIGAGSAGLGFISHYRKFNRKDEIVVFSKEIYPFYNRVMLPDYVGGQQSWEQLVKLREDQFAENGIIVHKNISVVGIDLSSKTLTDSTGKEHSFDKLMIATGSEAFMPPNFPKIPGLLNMRNRMDADALTPFKNPGSQAIVVGGGLLGLEMATSLREIDMDVTLVQRNGRFMDRQLDALGSSILHDEIIDRGIEVYYNDEVEQIYGIEKVEGIRLKSGHKIDCSLIIVAAGTRPVIDLAKNAGLSCHRGIEVNDYLQTSHPDVFACGEIAEWKGNLWGITAAAEQQATVAANYILGYKAKPYRGSLNINILKMSGLDLCSMGEIDIPPGSQNYEEVIFIDRSKHYYKKCLILNDRLVGALLIGDKTEFAEFKELIEKGIELSDKRLELLRSGKKPTPVLGKLICSCGNVGEENLKNSIKAGMNDFATLCAETGAGIGCGSCRPEIRKIILDTEREEKIKTLN